MGVCFSDDDRPRGAAHRPACREALGNIIPVDAGRKSLGFFYSLAERLSRNAVSSPFENSSATYHFCMRFLEEQSAQVDKGKARFDPLLEFLKANTAKNIGVDDMSAFLQMSRSCFTQAFPARWGQAPYAWFEELQLKTVVSALLTEESPVKEISVHCGFRDDNYFCRLFKKRYGQSPARRRICELAMR